VTQALGQAKERKHEAPSISSGLNMEHPLGHTFQTHCLDYMPALLRIQLPTAWLQESFSTAHNYSIQHPLSFRDAYDVNASAP
jgi:hypothetical protein